MRLDLTVTAFAMVPLLAAVMLYSQTARALVLHILYEVPTRIIRPLVLIVGITRVWFSGYSPYALTAITATFGGILLALLVQHIVLQFRRFSHTSGVCSVYEKRKWFALALPMLASRSFGFILLEIDILMVGVFLTPVDIAHYQAAVRTSMLAAMILYPQNAFLAPRIATLFQDGKQSEADQPLKNAVRFTFFLSIAFGVALIVFWKADPKFVRLRIFNRLPRAHHPYRIHTYNHIDWTALN